jgi:hypothetical protein
VTATVVPNEVATYLAAVREALSDLGAEERDDLLVEVEASLIETAGEDDRPIAARLGPAAEFAAELRASAGLPPAAAAAAPPADGTGLVAAVRAAAAAVAADPRVRSTGRTLAELAPIWWVVRAYVAVVLLGRLAGADWSNAHPSVPRIGNGGVIVVVLVAAVAASVALGLGERRRRRAAAAAALATGGEADGPGGAPGVRRWLVAANLVLAVAALPVGVHFLRAARSPIAATPFAVGFPVVPVAPTAPSSPLTGKALGSTGLITNIYPYTRDGRLLHDVLLFDQNGQPLSVVPGDTDPTRRVLTGPGGVRIFNSYPLRYFDPGTTRVGNPNAAPALAPPSLFTPAPAAAVAPHRPAAAAAKPRRRGH